jgi:hypothetical protein
LDNPHILEMLVDSQVDLHPQAVVVGLVALTLATCSLQMKQAVAAVALVVEYLFLLSRKENIRV